MIRVSDAAAEALSTFPMTLRTRVMWTATAATGIPGWTNRDITNRVLAGLGSIERSIAPALGGYLASPIQLTLDNRDGQLSPERADGFLPDSSRELLDTKITIEQGPVLPDGTVEYLPICSAVVDRAVESRGILDLSLVSRLGARMSRTTAAAYTPSPFDTDGSTAVNRALDDILIGLGMPSDLTVDPEVAAFMTGGWSLDINVQQGSSIGDTAGQICRCALATMIENEDGTLRVIGEYFPRQMGWQGGVGSRVFDETNVSGLDRTFAAAMGASEVIVSYHNGATMAYRDTAYEPRIGRMTKRLDLPYLPTAAQAYWAALVAQKSNAYPDLVSFGVAGLGLTLQLNDRVQCRFRAGEAPKTFRVIAKSWTPQGVGVMAIRAPSEASIFGTAFALWGMTAWGSGIVA